MKIFTYYDDLGWSFQKELLDIWYNNWQEMGFEPYILTPEDSVKHSLYKRLDSSMKEIYKTIMGHDIKPYGMSCWHRWLAYATIKPIDESFYVSDYDVFNTGWHPQKPEKKLHLLCGDCPCLASGTPLQFENLCHQFISLSKKNIKRIKKENKKPVFHDQNFFRNCSKETDGIIYTVIKEWNSDEPKLHHISHQASDVRLKKERQKYTNVNVNKMRVVMARELLDNK